MKPLVDNSRFKYDKDLSTDRAKVFYDTQSKKPIVSFRGTSLKRDPANDFISDIGIALGVNKISPRTQTASRLIKNAKDKYNSQKAISIGHSLGGDIARNAASRKDYVISYNQGEGLNNIYQKNDKKRHEFNIRTSGDIVSSLGSNKADLTIKNNNPYTAHNLNNLDKIKNKNVFV